MDDARRAFLCLSAAGIAAAGAGVALYAVAVAETAPAAEVDPIFAEIERHRAARVMLNDAIDFDEEPETWDAENEAEKAAWESFATTHPTTMAGVAAMTAYALHSPMGEEEDNLREVLRTVAAVTTKLARISGGFV